MQMLRSQEAESSLVFGGADLRFGEAHHHQGVRVTCNRHSCPPGVFPRPLVV